MNLALMVKIVERIAGITGHLPHLECWSLDWCWEGNHSLAVLARKRAGLRGGFELSYAEPGSEAEWHYWFCLSDPAALAAERLGAIRLRLPEAVVDLLDVYGRPLPLNATLQRHLGKGS